MQCNILYWGFRSARCLGQRERSELREAKPHAVISSQHFACREDRERPQTAGPWALRVRTGTTSRYKVLPGGTTYGISLQVASTSTSSGHHATRRHTSRLYEMHKHKPGAQCFGFGDWRLALLALRAARCAAHSAYHMDDDMDQEAGPCPCGSGSGCGDARLVGVIASNHTPLPSTSVYYRPAALAVRPQLRSSSAGRCGWHMAGPRLEEAGRAALGIKRNGPTG
jgi:hypothetical protein